MIDVNGPQAQYDAEERCLKIARTAAKYEYTKNVIQEIIGDNIVEPTRSNTPLDFVIKDKNADMPVGGIEHFHVSLICEGAEGNQLKSTAKKHEEQTKELFNKHENRVKRGTQYARFAFFRTANRLNQYYKTATGQRVAKRVNNGDFPYNVYDANGGIVKPETKKAKKAKKAG